MKLNRKLLFGTLLGLGLLAPLAQSQAQLINISVGERDRPYYTRGASYWDNDVHHVWVPGRSLSSGRWIHGRYEARERRNYEAQRSIYPVRDDARGYREIKVKHKKAKKDKHRDE